MSSRIANWEGVVDNLSCGTAGSIQEVAVHVESRTSRLGGFHVEICLACFDGGSVMPRTVVDLKGTMFLVTVHESGQDVSRVCMPAAAPHLHGVNVGAISVELILVDSRKKVCNGGVLDLAEAVAGVVLSEYLPLGIVRPPGIHVDRPRHAEGRV